MGHAEAPPPARASGPRGERVWYFAFGANMSSRALSMRRVQPLRREAAALADYRLTFGERGLPLLEPAFASIEAAPGEVVHGVLMELTGADFDRIDATEGRGYALVEVRVRGAVSGAIEALAFQTRAPVRGRRPSGRYLDLLCEGAREHGLPPAYIAWLAAQPSLRVPGTRLVSRVLMPLLAAAHRRLGSRGRRRWRPTRLE